MAVYFVTGKLGGGKTLAAVGRIRDYLLRGSRVATNLDLDLFCLLGSKKKNTVVYRIPDKPTVEDLNALGKGNESYDEGKNGLLVLDECGTWFNSRGWGDKTRQPVINWFLHARKLGWDILFIVQDIALVDKQAREALAEHVVYCRRLDRLNIPFLGFFFKLIFGKKLPGPKVHLAIVKYGDRETSLIVDRWLYRGRDLYQAYDTKQVFRDSDDGVYQLLPPWFSHGRYQIKKDFNYYKRKLRRFYLRKPWISTFASFAFSVPLSVFASVFLSSTNHVPSVDSVTVSNQTQTQIEESIDQPFLQLNEPTPPWVKKLFITGNLGNQYLVDDPLGHDSYSSSRLSDLGFLVIPSSHCSFELVGVGWRHQVTCRRTVPLPPPELPQQIQDQESIT